MVVCLYVDLRWNGDSCRHAFGQNCWLKMTPMIQVQEQAGTQDELINAWIPKFLQKF